LRFAGRGGVIPEKQSAKTRTDEPPRRHPCFGPRGLWLLVCSAFAALGDEGTSWIVRPVAVGVAVENLDVMVGPNDAVIVGYATTSQTGPGGDVVLARLATGGQVFQYRSEPGGGDAASFAADRFGNVFYATRDPQIGSLRAGQDFGGFGPMASSVYSASGGAVASSVPTVGINPDGMPTLIHLDQSGVRVLSTFDIVAGGTLFDALHLVRRNAEGQWIDEALPVDSRRASLTFNVQGELLVAADTPIGVVWITVVPEPSCLSLGGLAILLLLAYARKSGIA